MPMGVPVLGFGDYRVKVRACGPGRGEDGTMSGCLVECSSVESWEAGGVGSDLEDRGGVSIVNRQTLKEDMILQTGTSGHTN